MQTIQEYVGGCETTITLMSKEEGQRALAEMQRFEHPVMVAVSNLHAHDEARSVIATAYALDRCLTDPKFRPHPTLDTTVFIEALHGENKVCQRVKTNVSTGVYGNSAHVPFLIVYPVASIDHGMNVHWFPYATRADVSY